MSTLYDLAGTTSHSFKVGGPDGINISFGKSKPEDNWGNVGDIFVRTTTQLSPDEEFNSIAHMNANMTDMHNDFVASGKEFFYVVIEHDENHNNNETLYSYDGTNVTYLQPFGEPLGKLYYKTSTSNGVFWQSLGVYHFDEPIIKSVEDKLNQGDFYVSLKNADNGNDTHTVDKTSNKDTDYTVNHDNFGVTRFATDEEAVASNITNYKTYSSIPSNFNKNTTSHKFEDKLIAMTPEQVGKDIKVEMTRAINVEGYLKDLQKTNGRFDPTPNLVGAINELDTDIGKLADYDTSNGRFTTNPNIVGAINELDDAIGKLNDLRTSNKSDLVQSINSELDDRINSDNDLQRQIDAITSKTDVVDVVQCYDRGSDTSKTDIVHYDTSTLGDDDVIKVLVDETHNDEVSYWRYNCVPESAIVKVATKAELDTYDTSHLQADDIAIVQSDSSHSNQRTYYKLTVSGSTKTWTYVGVTSESWTYVGSVEAYYTKAASDERFLHISEADTNITGNKTFASSTTITFNNSTVKLGNNATATKPALNDNSTKVATTNWVNDLGNDVVHKSGNESITGQKEFKNANLGMKSPTFDTTNPSASAEHFAFMDKNGVEFGHLKAQYTSGGNYTTDITSTKVVNGENVSAVLTAGIDSNDKPFTTAVTPDTTNTTSSNNIATVGWVNDPNKSKNVVHQTGTETIGGTKTFSSNVKVPLTPTDNTHATSKKYVDDGLATKQPTIPITQSDNGMFLSNDGTDLEWRQVRDITTLSGLDDTNIPEASSMTQQNDGQVLMFDYASKKWKNGNPVVATIKYW